jgi:precorrin-6A/cobalt-precorrin-6A reductase
MRVLLLGGTAEARELAARLDEDEVIVSLAGALSAPGPVAGEVRFGGFGGADGLADYLRAHRIDAVIDATHPFASRISGNAALSCARTSIPLLRLERPSWAERDDASGWHWVDDLAAARVRAEELGSRILLAVGRQSLTAFDDWRPGLVVARAIEPPAFTLPDGWLLVRGRGPFPLADELTLLREHRIDVLVAKDSGGPTAAKLDAAAELGVAVVMVRRPPAPDAVAAVTSVVEAQQWLAQTRRSR